MSSEIDKIVAHYKYLCSAGYEGSLMLCSEKGQTHVKLDFNLGFILPPFSTPPPVSPPSRRKRSPGYYRRLKKRSDARQQLDSTYVNDDVPPPTHEVSAEEDVHQMVVMDMDAEKVSEDGCKQSIESADTCEDSKVTSTVNLADVNSGVNPFSEDATEVCKVAERIDKSVTSPPARYHSTADACSVSSKPKSLLPTPLPFQTQPGNSCCDHLCRPDADDLDYDYCCRHRCRKPWT